jgi:catechol 2,3-dioxygenase-like lactoylglutathione lyase family enzyme
MQRVTGVGGVFIKSRDPERLYAWYEKHLGLKQHPEHGGVALHWNEDQRYDPLTAWAVFPADSNYFDPSPAPFMINYRVADLDALLEALCAEGVAIDPQREDSDYGRFAWIFDPDGNKIELWEPLKK